MDWRPLIVAIMRPLRNSGDRLSNRVTPLRNTALASCTLTATVCRNRPRKEVVADGLQKCGANRAHNQKAGAEERVCETAQAFETLKEILSALDSLIATAGGHDQTRFQLTNC